MHTRTGRLLAPSAGGNAALWTQRRTCINHVRWCLYVDDIAVDVIGARSAVAEAITNITGEVVESLEQELKMKVSRREQWASDGPGKTVLAVNDARVRSAVTTSMRSLGMKIQGKAAHLGMQFQPGARTQAPTFDQSRWAATVKRRGRARRLGAQLGSRIFHTGILSASIYGASIAYPSKRTLLQSH